MLLLPQTSAEQRHFTAARAAACYQLCSRQWWELSAPVLPEVVRVLLWCPAGHWGILLREEQQCLSLFAMLGAPFLGTLGSASSLRQSALLRGGSEGCAVARSGADSVWIPVEQNTRECNKISIWKTFCPSLRWFSEAAFHCMPRRSHSIRKCGSSCTLFKAVHKRLFYFLGP